MRSGQPEQELLAAVPESPGAQVLFMCRLAMLHKAEKNVQRQVPMLLNPSEVAALYSGEAGMVSGSAQLLRVLPSCR